MDRDDEPDETFLLEYEREYAAADGGYDDETSEPERTPGPVNWNLLTAVEAEREWGDLDSWVYWLRVTFGLSPTILPPYWHRHDELIWELSALHTCFLACYTEDAPAAGPIGWMREFAEARHRLRDWVAQCGSRLDLDRPTRQTIWPGEHAQPQAGEVEIVDRQADFTAFVRADVARRQRLEDAIRAEFRA